MIFEDALAQLRLGKKIKHPSMDEDVWFQRCYVSIMGSKIDTVSIVKMKGEYEHPDMRPSFKIKSYKHGHTPQLDFFIIMSDEWEVFE